MGRVINLIHIISGMYQKELPSALDPLLLHMYWWGHSTVNCLHSDPSPLVFWFEIWLFLLCQEMAFFQVLSLFPDRVRGLGLLPSAPEELPASLLPERACSQRHLLPVPSCAGAGAVTWFSLVPRQGCPFLGWWLPPSRSWDFIGSWVSLTMISWCYGMRWFCG